MTGELWQEDVFRFGGTGPGYTRVSIPIRDDLLDALIYRAHDEDIGPSRVLEDILVVTFGGADNYGTTRPTELRIACLHPITFQLNWDTLCCLACGATFAAESVHV